MNMTQWMDALLARCSGLRLRTLLLGLVLALAPLLALIPLGGARADSDPCTTATDGTITCVFNYTGAAQTWTVPDGVTQATFYVFGARGGDNTVAGTFGHDAAARGGNGGEATAVLPLTSGDSITLMVGGAGEDNVNGCIGVSLPGGFNGGGVGGGGACPGSGGGGASDVRIGGTDLANRVLVAGGGGGATQDCEGGCANGGVGGGLTGGNGETAEAGPGGVGGNQDGTTGSGKLGDGGIGATGASSSFWLPIGAGGGGGGGGYYGGAGGPEGEGGGGGSGYGPSGTVFASGVNRGNGLIVITTAPVAGVTATPDRTPDSNGWYNAPVTVTAQETIDALKSLVTCTNQKYSGPDSSLASVTVSCTDNANNTAQVTYSFRYDATPPTTTTTLTTGNNATYKLGDWSNQPVQVSLSASDNTDGSAVAETYYAVDTPDCTPSNPAACTVYTQRFAIDTDGSHTLTYFSMDNAGNVEAAQRATINVDQALPTITAQVTPTDPASSGWYNQSTGAPTVSFTCSDATSGIPPDACPSSHLFGEGANQSYSASVTDNAGNSNSATVSGINVDLHAPTASPTLSGQQGSNGWYVGPVTVTWHWADTGSSGLADTCPATSTYDGPDSATASASASCADLAGNGTTATSPTFKLDQAAPTITLTTPQDGAVYTLNQSVSASYTCADATSGITANGCSGTVPSGSPIATGTLGSHSFTVRATDSAGHTASQTVSYSVDYGIRVLSSPTTPIPRGSAAIFRLSVVDGQGHNLSSRSLTVTALNLAPVSQPWSGQHGNYQRTFTFSQGIAPGGGYLLVVNTYNLAPGPYVLSFQVEGDPSIHTLQFVVR